MTTTNGILAIDIGGTKVALAAVDLQGRWLAQDRFIIAGLTGPVIVAHLIAAAQALQRQAGLTVQGIGVSTIGVVAGTQLKLVPTIVGWDQINLRQALQSAFTAVPV